MELQRFLNVPEARKDHLLKHFSLAYPNTRHIHTQTHASLCLYSGHLGCRKRIGVWPNGRWQLRFEKTHFKMLSPWKEGLCVLVCMSLCEAHSLWTSVNIVNVCMCVCVCELNMTSSLTLSVLDLITRHHLIHRVPVPALHLDKWVNSVAHILLSLKLICTFLSYLFHPVVVCIIIFLFLEKLRDKAKCAKYI